MMKLILILTAYFIQSTAVAQDEKSPVFNFTVSSAYGDLNKDGILDLVIVTQDTASNFGPYRLEIFFTQPNGDKKLIVQSDQAIEEQYPNGKDGWLFGNALEQVSIKKGVVWIEMGFLRGHMEHKFRYQNNQFELIGYTFTNVSSDHLTTIDFNLSTGHRIEKFGLISEKLDVVSDTIIKFNPLPNLADFKPHADPSY